MPLHISSSRSLSGLSHTRTAAITVAMLLIVRSYIEMNLPVVERLTTVTTKQAHSENVSGYHPRVVHFCRSGCAKYTRNQTKLRRVYELPEALREVQGNEMSIARGKCPYKKDWQDHTYPTCNNVHEIDFFNMLQKVANTDESKQVHYLGTGGSRDTWKIFDKHIINNKNYRYNNTIQHPLAFKTLRIDREYTWPRVDHQRIDAIVSERLTASPHVVDIYGYCGTATINEFGVGGTLDHNILDNNNISPLQKLEYGRDIAYALADLHELDGYPSSTVQHDLKPKNVLVVANGKVKLGDFNNAHFLGKNTDQRCLFGFRQACQTMKIAVCTVLQVRLQCLPVFH
jgi:hypothetical protein